MAPKKTAPAPESKSAPPPDSLVVVYTGGGKGKTTAALGMAIRAVGRGWRVCMVQFIKGSWHYGEEVGAKRLEPDFEMVKAGKGFVGILDDKLPREEHEKAAREALEGARKRIASGNYRLVILDEINYAVQMGLLKKEEVLDLVKSRPSNVHLVLTGNHATPELVELADLVTEMREVKHPFRRGIPAQKGIDY
ncbi:MAG: cob(I)yrinic acid a,c-diamide adenosyltransferase [Halobacteria archaeon]